MLYHKSSAERYGMGHKGMMGENLYERFYKVDHKGNKNMFS